MFGFAIGGHVGPVTMTTSLAAALAVASAGTAHASCAIEQVGGTQRHVVRCSDGVTIRPEPGAAYTLLDRDRSGDVDAVRLDGKAVLVEVPKGTDFRVVAPQAIAAVRGTRWAVDVGSGTTSVFVVEGSVAVARRTGGRGVTLGPGEGVDVTDDGQPLTKKRWGRARAAALLARLGL